MNNHPILSIIIPLYNCEKYISQCIDSIFAQDIDKDKFEVIIIDDGSNDNSYTIALQYCNYFNNIFVIKQDNQGVACARNNAINIASGKYVTFVDADDMIVLGSLSSLLNIAIEYNADIVKGTYVKVSQNDDYNNYRMDKEGELSVEVMTGHDAIVKVTKYKEGYCWRYLLSRKLIKDNNIEFPQKISFMEDWVFITHVLLKCQLFVNTNILFYLYRYNVSSCVANMTIEKLQQGCNSIDIVLRTALILNGIVKRKLIDDVCANINIILWYIIHYHCLYRNRNELVKLLIRLLKLVEQQNIPLNLLLFRISPKYYIVIRYLIAKRKF